ncbi:MAG: ribosomal protein S18-alanine N-acetyltransferase [Anaerolineae bacterium]|nr:ribosomal protein S18-alanine N-acetyltransferase [Anaerolineae bacterium]
MAAHDIPAVVTVDRQVFVDPWPETAYVQELYFNPNAHYFILTLIDPAYAKVRHQRRKAREPRVIGFVGMRVEGDEGHISTLALRSEWRGNRLGEMMFLAAMVRAMDDGAWRVALEVRVSNQIAINLYSKYGFNAASQLRRYYANGEDAYLMRAALNNFAHRQHLRDQFLTLHTKLQVDVSEKRDSETVKG